MMFHQILYYAYENYRKIESLIDFKDGGVGAGKRKIEKRKRILSVQKHVTKIEGET